MFVLALEIWVVVDEQFLSVFRGKRVLAVTVAKNGVKLVMHIGIERDSREGGSRDGKHG